MVRNVLLVIEILVAVAALGGGVAALYRGRHVLAGQGGPAAGRGQVFLDVVAADAVLAVMAVAAWAVYAERSWARWMSIIAGAALVAGLALRPTLAGRQWATSPIALLGVLVAVLGFLLPGGG